MESHLGRSDAIFSRKIQRLLAFKGATSMTNFRLFFLLLLLMPLGGLAKPPGGITWTPFAPMTDEFDGDRLDLTKWHSTNPRWKGRRPVFFHKSCVEVRDGKLLLSAKTSAESEKLNLPRGYTHVSGFVRSRSTARFGYYEIRAKLMDSSLVSCFWASNHQREEWSEIDCVEMAAGVEEHTNFFRPNMHYFYGPHSKGSLNKHIVNPSRIKIPFDPREEFHTYGFLWTPTKIQWFIDDISVRTTPNTHCFQPLFMNINVEANKYFKALPQDDRLPAVYEIDWVRSWRPEDENNVKKSAYAEVEGKTP